MTGSKARTFLVSLAALSLAALMPASGQAQQSTERLEPMDLGEFLGETPEKKPAALGDCLAGEAEDCGPKAAQASRSFSRTELCDLDIVEGSECRVAATKKQPQLRPGERTRLLIVEDDEPDTAPLPSIDVEILFAYGADAPLPSSGPELRALAETVSDPRFAESRFVVIGHTDAAGSDTYNQALSTRRAAAVRDQLMLLTGAEHQRFVVAGRGESDLKDPADPLAAENRRVQIVLLR
ncbi:OmpA family protein [Jiella marina]|uniref:OmpA family protein n=1 Tax=Jiella sp. LLJ827 TaxID=2917712 RepID=UPI00210192AF|nr:OmpA family protein [Jiella sp. LLJ827]MCQ0988943.1 OmpA family protein [Jiella sp. LLJ827]